MCIRHQQADGDSGCCTEINTRAAFHKQFCQGVLTLSLNSYLENNTPPGSKRFQFCVSLQSGGVFAVSCVIRFMRLELLLFSCCRNPMKIDWRSRIASFGARVQYVLSLHTETAFQNRFSSDLCFLETRINGCHKRWYGQTKAREKIDAERLTKFMAMNLSERPQSQAATAVAG